MRIADKIDEIEKYLTELKSFVPTNYKLYTSDPKTKAACERYFEKIIEAVVDLVFLIIKENSFKIPEDDKESFDILVKEQIIPQNLADRLKDAKGMRNIIAHQYGNVDDELVFESITDELITDVGEFITHLQKNKL
jgi:uncharacterized protein YutE (UPF0331/DUF86 family)